MSDYTLVNYDSGEWLSADKSEGMGRDEITYTAPSWQGRESRKTLRLVRSGRYFKAVTFEQLGVVINEATPEKLVFPAEGGDIQVMLTTNAATLVAALTSEEAKVYSTIKFFTTAAGTDMTINQQSLEYGFPGDPGLEGPFQVSVVISMPATDDGYEKFENLTVNGILIPIYQVGEERPYINVDKEFEELDAAGTSTTIQISSNQDYTIEIVECVNQMCDEDCELDDDDGADSGEGDGGNSLNVTPKEVNLDVEGSAKSFQVEVTPDDLKWEVQG